MQETICHIFIYGYDGSVKTIRGQKVYVIESPNGLG